MIAGGGNCHLLMGKVKYMFQKNGLDQISPVGIEKGFMRRRSRWAIVAVAILCIALPTAWGQDKVAPYLRQKVEAATRLSTRQMVSAFQPFNPFR